MEPFVLTATIPELVKGCWTTMGENSVVLMSVYNRAVATAFTWERSVVLLIMVFLSGLLIVGLVGAKIEADFASLLRNLQTLVRKCIRYIFAVLLDILKNCDEIVLDQYIKWRDMLCIEKN